MLKAAKLAQKSYSSGSCLIFNSRIQLEKVIYISNSYVKEYKEAIYSNK